MFLLAARNNKSVRPNGRGRTVLDQDLAAQQANKVAAK
jgi:hypothetical protein